MVNFKSPHFTYIKKSVHHYCHSLMNKTTVNFKQNSQLNSLQKKPQSMRQFEQPLFQKLRAKILKINAI